MTGQIASLKKAISKDQILGSGQSKKRKNRKQQPDLRDFPDIEWMQYDEGLGLVQGKEK